MNTANPEDLKSLVSDGLEDLAQYIERDLARRYPTNVIDVALIQLALTRVFLSRLDEGVSLDEIKADLMHYADETCDKIIQNITPPRREVN